MARELAPAGLRSRPKPNTAFLSSDSICRVAAATQPSGSKLPRHRGANFGQIFWPHKSPFGLSCRSLKRRVPQDCVQPNQPAENKKC
ncbi:hypothetical protein DJ564_00505 [Pseudomonas sp. 31-12]|nr:hypothetical protein DJ564_00505 [Pseudomonas sp. 31-12]